MRTVQEVLNSMDKQKLIDVYFYRFPINLQELDNNATIADTKEIAHERMDSYLERLRTLLIIKDDNQGIFFVHRCIKDDMHGEEFRLVFLNELKANCEKAQSYGSNFIEQSKLMGYWIAETALTKYYLEDLMVDILYEALFFGFNQEHLQEEKEELNRRIIEEKTDDIPVEDFFAELEREQGFKLDRQSLNEEKLEMKVIKMTGEYWEHSYKKELRNVMKRYWEYNKSTKEKSK